MSKLSTPTLTISGNQLTISNIDDNATNLKIYKNGNLYQNISLLPDYLCFTANTAGSTIELCKMGSPNIANTAYSRDRKTWTTFTPSTTAGTNVITLTNIGDKVYFRNDINGNFDFVDNFLQFKMTGSIAASGNINSMYLSEGFNNLSTLTYKYCYACMFANCTSLTTAPELPATVLTDGCYYEMFTRCTSLTSVPDLCATTLGTYCCYEMFDECTSLTTAPELPATVLAQSCYQFMFMNCTSLTTAPALPANTLAIWCYYGMFANCPSLTTAPVLSATVLTEGCYYEMFEGCTSLKINNDGSSGTLFFTCPATIPYYAVSLMFTNTRGSYSDDPVANGTYYYY